MLANRVKDAAQIPESSAIELKGDNRGPAYRRQAEHQSEVSAPCEMFLPAMLARMK
jgi:hypothetical protein